LRADKAPRKVLPWTPSERQLDVLKAIAAISKKQGWAPSVAELARALGVTAVRAQQHLEKLTARGLVKRGAKWTSRTIGLTDAGRALASR
jgi:Mn-dependent DtxR family transcriptional regulator